MGYNETLNCVWRHTLGQFLKLNDNEKHCNVTISLGIHSKEIIMQICDRR